MTAADLLLRLNACGGVLLKLRRGIVNRRGWTEEEWFERWPMLAPILVTALAQWEAANPQDSNLQQRQQAR